MQLKWREDTMTSSAKSNWLIRLAARHCCNSLPIGE